MSPFGYTEGKEVLSDFHMQIARGQCVAIVGESGSGKSTLAKLLLGFYPLQKGTINICGKNGRNSTIEEMRDLIAYVPQEPYLYEVSIAENIAYGRGKKTQEVAREDIVNAAKIANAHEFIMRLPKGYDTIPRGEWKHLIRWGTPADRHCQSSAEKRTDSPA